MMVTLLNWPQDIHCTDLSVAMFTDFNEAKGRG